MNNSEYLSDFLKNDRFIPFITLTVNIRGSKWDGATNIHEMLDINDKFLLGFIPNYHMNLLSPDQIDDKDFDKFKMGIGSLLQFIKHKNDKNMDWIKDKKRFEHVDIKTANFIRTVTGTKIKFNQNEEEVNMCTAWKNSMNEARNEGRREGRREGKIKGKIEGILEEKVETAKRLLSENYSLDIIQTATNLTLDQIKSFAK